jgi:hypothetical protein
VRRCWHSHRLGQLDGDTGHSWTQYKGEPIVEIRIGEVIWCPAGHPHWHGATPTSAMAHYTIQETLDGKVVDWIEPVPDEIYLAVGVCDISCLKGWVSLQKQPLRS